MGSMSQNMTVPPPVAKPKLRDQLRDAFRRKHFSLRTE
jgi:hypothetical protein